MSSSSSASRSSATSRTSSCESKNPPSTPNASVIRASTDAVSGRASCSIWLRYDAEMRSVCANATCDSPRSERSCRKRDPT
ncbi:Uncharacterised protein [Mycobacteroides abscessus subsp. abscessus]|nr:Uncharacterised protein [Mycobacteroides abscessus subsp. abscessus]